MRNATSRMAVAGVWCSASSVALFYGISAELSIASDDNKLCSKRRQANSRRPAERRKPEKQVRQGDGICTAQRHRQPFPQSGASPRGQKKRIRPAGGGPEISHWKTGILQHYPVCPSEIPRRNPPDPRHTRRRWPATGRLPALPCKKMASASSGGLRSALASGGISQC